MISLRGSLPGGGEHEDAKGCVPPLSGCGATPSAEEGLNMNWSPAPAGLQPPFLPWAEAEPCAPWVQSCLIFCLGKMNSSQPPRRPAAFQSCSGGPLRASGRLATASSSSGTGAPFSSPSSPYPPTPWESVSPAPGWFEFGWCCMAPRVCMHVCVCVCVCVLESRGCQFEELEKAGAPQPQPLTWPSGGSCVSPTPCCCWQ